MIFRLLMVLAWFTVVMGTSALGQITTGYFVAPSDKLTPANIQQLENKVKGAINAAGLTATDRYFPLVTIVKYDEYETIAVELTEKVFQTEGEVTIYLMLENSNSSLGSTIAKIKGIGNSVGQAQANAIRNINFSPEKLRAMFTQAKTAYSAVLEQTAEKTLREAQRLLAQKQYSESIDAAAAIPAESKYYPAAQKLLKQIAEATAEEALRKAQSYYGQQKYEEALEAASEVPSGTQSYTTAQQLTASIRKERKQEIAKQESEQKKEMERQQRLEAVRENRQYALSQRALQAMERVGVAQASTELEREKTRAAYTAMYLKALYR